MLPDEDKWEIYGQAAAEIVNNEHSILEQFIEAIRVLRLPFHRDVLGRLRHLENSTISMMYMLWQIHCNKNDRELECILTYLNYWKNK